MQKRIEATLKQYPEIEQEVETYGGVLMVDNKTGSIFHVCDEGKTYYQKWNNEHARFELVEHRMGGLDRFDLAPLKLIE